MLIIVLCTGARDWPYPIEVETALDNLASEGDVYVYEGGADGADKASRVWALKHAVGCTTTHAIWKRHGNSAGHMRNTAQARAALRHFSDLKARGKDARLVCLAFPGPRRNPARPSGTERQMATCEALGFQVIDRGKR